MNNKYYLLGFVVGDGTISKSGVISICLARRDISLLECFSMIFGGKVKKTISKIGNKTYKSVRYSIPVEVRDELLLYGLMCRKTYEDTSSIFNNVPPEFKMDFIRGYFDADGCIYKVEKKYTFGIVSKRPEILKSIKNWFKNKINHKIPIKYDKTSEVYRLLQNGNILVEKIFEQLYYKNCLCLNRKFDIFSKCKAHKFKGYTFHKASKKYRITMKPFVGKNFSTEEECKEFIKENHEKFIGKVATT